ncbi:P-loop containing nucleoside triphosphate hydrolase protein [Clavulina sp. PMI_390]|nr:P-loop containing nucleoside triphosphate hydrolase protein [Clavulina sp. PMI_390]
MASSNQSLLDFDLNAALKELLDAHPNFSFPDPLSQTTSASDKLRALSRLLAFPALTEEISILFRPLIIDLCSRWLENDELDQHSVFEAFCILLKFHNELLPIMHTYFSHPQRIDGPLVFLLDANIAELAARPLQRLLVAYHRLLVIDERFPERKFWSPTPLNRLIHTPHPDPGVRVLAILCFSLQVGQHEKARETAYWDHVGEPGVLDAPIDMGERLVDDVAVPTTGDAWVIQFIESRRLVGDSSPIRARQSTLFSQPSQIRAEDLSPYAALLSNTLVFKPDPSPPRPTELVVTPSVSQAIDALASMLSQCLPILIHSVPGAGKSLLIKHLAGQIHPSSSSQVVSLHLSDTSIDPKSLVGSYVPSTSRPGSFEWVEGPLVSSLRAGKWLVLEDIDKATSEILGTIMPLVESLRASKGAGEPARLFIPSRDMTVEAKAGFALFATSSSNIAGEKVPRIPTFLGSHHWHPLHLPAPGEGEQSAILSSLFPQLYPSAITSLVKVFESVRGSASTAGSSGRQLKSREIGIRDLIKWTRRVQHHFPRRGLPSDDAMDIDSEIDDETSTHRVLANPEVKDRIFLDARDIFFGSTATQLPFTGASPGAIITTELALSVEQAEWVLQTRTPELHIERSPSDGCITSILIGRVAVHARPPSLLQPPPNATVKSFALHRPSLILLEQLACAAKYSEPLLLVGETGTGKTTAIQHLASLLSHPLTVFNLSNQTEVADLVGGFKPIDARVPASQLQVRFTALFNATFSLRRNAEFDQALRKALQGGKWKRVVAMWRDALSKALTRIREIVRDQLDSDAPRKRRKVDAPQDMSLPTVSEEDWADFEKEINSFEIRHVLNQAKFAFAFVEGPLVRAIREGHWVLLDEINLASSETLEAISPLLQSPTSSLTLTEQGTLEPVPRHPSFRLFASMNPATDVGKKDLPSVMRSNFTELWVPPPDSDREALLAIISQRIGHLALAEGRGIIADVADFYEAIRKLSDSRQISDGSNQRPHFSMRTLTRALMFASDVASSFGLRRGIWEGCLMAFTMSLDARSAEIVRPLAEKHLLAGVKNKPAFLAQTPSHSGQADGFVSFGPFRLHRGPETPDAMDHYILTPSVQSKLVDLSRIICTRRFPVLIEGPTSAGKTSSIEYLARRTGHRFVRINNHEHTDIQEYIGTYVSDPKNGKLVFRDGVLVRALRQGHWLVLDELNLAPTDVLEALNRLLDDNRELLIPETQEIITPHPSFMLFATQNPPGLYAGRKVLSRAFRNRFLEVHFADVPQAELETIIHQRSRIAPSYAQRIVGVFKELQSRRQSGRIFESKHGFATLRDLFRWAGRGALGYQQLAEDGYMLLAERTRDREDKATVKATIESVMKVKINDATLYDLNGGEGTPAARLALDPGPPSNIVWTSAFQRVFVLAATALKNHEPVLLVGDTGAGKTSVCQYLADMSHRELYALNCHQNTETADLLGGQRPIRNRSALLAETRALVSARLQQLSYPHLHADGAVSDLITTLDNAIRNIAENSSVAEELRSLKRSLKRTEALFEWDDGPLVKAMSQGAIFLMDEISLADDSVLERLNSVLEPERTLVLAEKGGWAGDYAEVIASPGFDLVATMNPGGDYGKKELSPALRNRFTEIWVPQVDLRGDRKQILDSLWKHKQLHMLSDPILDVAEQFSREIRDPTAVGLRDIQAWANFINIAFAQYSEVMTLEEIFYHGACLTLIDGLATLPQLSVLSTDALAALEARLTEIVNQSAPSRRSALPDSVSQFGRDSNRFFVGAFGIELGDTISDSTFNLGAPTTIGNAMRVVRASQLGKPILLEGSPGVGKTSLITALAAFSGHRLCRVNLSDQSDIMDLFGSDLPVEGGKPGEFQWRDAAFLRALQEGEWVLLDEMNLAPQAVLEGLNAVLDHRGSVFVPELGRTFEKHPSFRIFAAQNPLGQGGGRKGLPKSFLNRFTKVYLKELLDSDLLTICQREARQLSPEALASMVRFNSRLQKEVIEARTIGHDGSPWEFNLRDILRWIRLTEESSRAGLPFDPSSHVGAIYVQRFRTVSDRQEVARLFEAEFPQHSLSLDLPRPSVSVGTVQVGHTTLSPTSPKLSRHGRFLALPHQLAALEAAGACLDQGWLLLLTGPAKSGKTTLAHLLAQQKGFPLEVMPMNPATDPTDLLGNFEQADSLRRFSSSLEIVLGIWDSAQLSSTATLEPRARHALHRLRAASTSPVLPGERPELVRNAKILREISYLSEMDIVIHDLESLLSETDGGRFDWVDGPLVRAMRDGRWLLLDNANLCSPAVLDRLNSLAETNGFLTLSERGLVGGEVVIIRPHADFRLLMSVDPMQGELSRAMRNRGIELYIPSPSKIGDAPDAQQTLPEVSSPENAVTVFHRQNFVSGLPMVDSFISTSNLVASTLENTQRSLQADSSYVICAAPPSMWRRMVRALPLVNLEENSATDITKTIDVVLQELLKPMSGLNTESTRFDDQVIWTPIDILLNPYITHSTSPSLPLDLITLACRVAENHPSPHSTAESPLHISTLLRSGRTPPGSFHSAVPLLAPFLDLCQATIKTVVEIVSNSLSSSFTSIIITTAGEVHLLGQILRRESSVGPFNLTATRSLVQRINNVLRDSDPLFIDLKTSLSALIDVTALSTGHGMVAIWQSQLPKAVNQNLAALETSLAQRIHQHFDIELRQVAFDLLVTLFLKRPLSPAQTRDIEQLCHRVLLQLPEDGSPVLDQPTQVGVVALFAELGVLCDPLESAASISLIMAQVLERESQLIDWVPLKALSWSRDLPSSSKDDLRIRVNAHKEWMKRISSYHNKLGISPLTHASLLMESLHHWGGAGMTFGSLVAEESHLRHQKELLLDTIQRNTKPRSMVMLDLLLENVFLLIEALQPHYEPARHEEIKEQIAAIKAGDSTALQTLALLLDTTDSGPIWNPLRLHLVSTFSQIPQDAIPTWILVAHSWVQFSLAVLDIYVPDAALDPVLVHEVDRAVYSTRRSFFDEFTHRLVSHEFSTTGSSSNSLIDDYQRRAKLHQGEYKQDTERQPDVGRVDILFTEIGRFMTQLSSTPLQIFEASSDSARASFSVVIGTIHGFIQRLEVSYSDLQDLINPLIWALESLKLGLSIFVSMAPPTRAVAHLMRSLATFPSISSASLTSEPVDGVSATSTILNQVATLAYTASVDGQTSQTSPQLLVLYSGLLRLWSRDREREQREREDASSIYKSRQKNYDMEDEEAVKEEEFRALFPSFDEIQLPLDATPPPIGETSSVTLVSKDHAREFLELHLSIFTPDGEKYSVTRKTLINRRRLFALAVLKNTDQGDFPSALDDDSHLWQLSLMDDRLHAMQNSTQSPSPDFYHEENIPETRRIIPILQSLRSRLLVHIQEWPDQMVLRHLLDEVDRILAIPVTASVARMLSSIERLVMLIDDWEGYANRENSLKDFQTALVNLVIDWRHLELRCWHQLLDSERKIFNDGVSEWCFRLYELLIVGTVSLSSPSSPRDTSEITQHVQECVPLLDEYILSSPLGQFEIRLDLLIAFSCFARMIGPHMEPQQAHGLSVIASFLDAIIYHYRLHIDDVRSDLTKGREPIQREIVDYIKLASWKDVNVLALKQSADKTHRHLHRCLRKYRDVLKRPALPSNISPFRPIQASQPSLEWSNFPLWESPPPPPFMESQDSIQFADLPGTFSRFKSILNNDVARSLLETRPYSEIEDLSTQIVERTQTLSSLPIPSSKGDSQEKTFKSLVSQKRRALSDLVKELRRLGVSATPKPEVLARQESRAQLLADSLPGRLEDVPLLEMSLHAERYYHRLIDGLPILHQTMSSHHADISTRDLQRVLGLTESTVHFGVMSRDMLLPNVRSYDRLLSLCSCFQVSTTGLITGSFSSSKSASPSTGELLSALCRIDDAVQEVIQHVEALSTRPTHQNLHEDLVDLYKYGEDTRALVSSLRGVKSLLCEDWTLVTRDEEIMIHRAHDHFIRFSSVLESSRSFPTLRPAYRSLLDWHHREVAHLAIITIDPHPKEEIPVTMVINSFLLAAQALRTWSQSHARDDDDQQFIHETNSLRELSESFRFEAITSTLKGFLQCAAASCRNGDHGAVAHDLSRIKPFLEEYLRVAHSALMYVACWTKSTFKLAWILSSLLHNLEVNGLCKPPEQESDQTKGESTEMTDASGLGAGSGDKDISDEIEDESQIEGLKGEEDQQPDTQAPDASQDDAIEMENDFDGDLEDPSNPGLDEENDSKEGEDSPEVDDQMQDLADDDPNAIDEKLWSGEKGPEDTNPAQDQQREAQLDHDNNSELAAKEQDNKKPGSDAPDAEPEDPNPPTADQEQDDTKIDEPDADELPDESADHDQGRKLDDNVNDENALDLPDDMNIDPEEADENLGGDELSVVSDNENPMEAVEETGGESPNPAPEATADDVGSEAADDSGQAEVNPSVINPHEEPSQPTAQTGEGAQGGAVSGSMPNDPRAPEEDDSRGQDIDASRPIDTEVGSRAEKPDRRPDHEPSKPQEERGKTESRMTDSTEHGEQPGDSNHAPLGGEMAPPTDEPTSMPNPLRNLGDALKSIRRRFDDILETQDTPQPPSDQTKKPGDEVQMEYAPSAPDDNDQQALGPSQVQEDIPKLKDLSIEDQPDEGSPPTSHEPESHADTKESTSPDSFINFDTLNSLQQESGQDAESGPQPQLGQSVANSSQKPDLPGVPQSEGMDVEVDTPEEALEVELRAWQILGQPVDGARELWRRYTSITQHLAHDLCEQLRLILEPTLATRLRGDYRTGKRLNMKKVIPYIASEFTKDKIWLRRTRPSKREYQILLALDDSRSMREGRAAHLAFESLALVVKALDRLEVGDTAVMRFGETVDVLHNFEGTGGGAGFSDEAGAKVLQNFSFEQRATNVLSLIERSLEVLAEARTQKTGGSTHFAELWQLEIIISDGICQDHEKLRTMLRRATEQRVMIVFLIVDGLRNQSGTAPAKSSNSILNMNHASYAMVHGKMELQLQRYLDLFPFEYYVVLRDVESLPEVLAGTLKQFFEQISED